MVPQLRVRKRGRWYLSEGTRRDVRKKPRRTAMVSGFAALQCFSNGTQSGECETSDAVAQYPSVPSMDPKQALDCSAERVNGRSSNMKGMSCPKQLSRYPLN